LTKASLAEESVYFLLGTECESIYNSSPFYLKVARASSSSPLMLFVAHHTDIPKIVVNRYHL
jgi:hypothetical protein